jgi:hypothetical protein
MEDKPSTYDPDVDWKFRIIMVVALVALVGIICVMFISSKPIHEGVLSQKRYDLAHEGKECHLVGGPVKVPSCKQVSYPDRWFVVIVAGDKHKTYQLSKTEWDRTRKGDYLTFNEDKKLISIQ